MSDDTKPIDPLAGLDFTKAAPVLRGVALAQYSLARKALYKAVLLLVTRDPDEENILEQIQRHLDAHEEVPAELSTRLHRKNVPWPMNALLLVWTLTLTREEVGTISSEPSKGWPAFLTWSDGLPPDALTEAEKIAATLMQDERRVELVPKKDGAAPAVEKKA